MITKLEGKVLNNKWVLNSFVNQSIINGVILTASYYATYGEIEGFVKLFDIAPNIDVEERGRAHMVMGSCLKKERTVKEATTRNLRRLVNLLDSGVHTVTFNLNDMHFNISYDYVVFEKAQADFLQLINLSQIVDLSVFFQMIHHTSTGLMELHSLGCVHQNVKPTSIFKYGESSYKLGDYKKLYFSDHRDGEFHDYMGQFDSRHFHPIEIEFGHMPPEVDKRLAHDLYSLGNMVYFYFTNTSITEEYLSAVMDPNNNTIPDFHSSLPIMIEVMDSRLSVLGNALEEFNLVFIDELMVVLKELIHPDPMKRGSKKAVNNLRIKYDMQRYVSKFGRFHKLCHYYQV